MLTAPGDLGTVGEKGQLTPCLCRTQVSFGSH